MSVPIRIPADFEPHERTVMAFAVHREWGSARDRVERELESAVRAIAEDEPVTLLTPPDLVGAARVRFRGCEVEIVAAPVDDVWMRDIAPVFAKRGRETVAVDLNFNGWDGSRPPRPGDRLARIFDFGVPVVGTPFVGEGGAFLTDGRGLAIATRSCLMARNPHLGEADLAAAFGALGMRTTLWLDGDRGEPITSGHPDGYVAFAPEGAILVESIARGAGSRSRRRDVAALGKATADLRHLPKPLGRSRRFASESFAATYVNLFVTSRQVITARFGDPSSDGEAERALTAAFPGRAVRMLDVDAILSGGGGIRCLTQPVPV